MRIMVGDLSKLYGLSNQTLHYYEDRGILVPKRDVVNGYRYYESFDMQKLGTIKKYRNAGFALNDGAYTYEHTAREDVVGNYRRRRAELEEEIQERKHIIAQLDWDIAVHERYLQVGDAYMVEELEGFLRFESKDRQIVFQEEGMRKEAAPWFRNIFFTASSEMWYADANGNFSHHTNGMIADNTTAKRLGLGMTAHVAAIPGGRYLTQVVCTQANYEGRQQQHDACVAYAREQGFLPCGHVFTRFVFIFTERGEAPHCYKMLLLPIKA